MILALNQLLRARWTLTHASRSAQLPYRVHTVPLSALTEPALVPCALCCALCVRQTWVEEEDAKVLAHLGRQQAEQRAGQRGRKAYTARAGAVAAAARTGGATGGGITQSSIATRAAARRITRHKDRCQQPETWERDMARLTALMHGD